MKKAVFLKPSEQEAADPRLIRVWARCHGRRRSASTVVHIKCRPEFLRSAETSAATPAGKNADGGDGWLSLGVVESRDEPEPSDGHGDGELMREVDVPIANVDVDFLRTFADRGGVAFRIESEHAESTGTDEHEAIRHRTLEEVLDLRPLLVLDHHQPRCTENTQEPANASTGEPSRSVTVSRFLLNFYGRMKRSFAVRTLT